MSKRAAILFLEKAVNYTKAQKIFKKYYGVDVSEWQTQNNIENIRRKNQKGNLDDLGEKLYIELVNAGYIQEGKA